MMEANGSDQFLNVRNQTHGSSATCTGPSLSKTAHIFTLLVIITSSLFGNLLIVGAFFRYKLLRTPVHCFIVNMAISDLLIPAITLPAWISSIYNDGIWFIDGVVGTVLCKVVENTWNVSTFVSIFSMSAIAADRFHAVLFPTRLALFSRMKCRLTTTAIWIASVAFHAHYFYGVKLVSYGTRYYCFFQWEPASQMWEVARITWILFVCLTSLSFIVLTVLYSSIVISINKQKTNFHLGSKVLKRRAKENRKITCMLIVIVIIFYAVWIPQHILYYVIYFQPSTRFPCIFTSLGSILPSLCPVANPMVYYIFNDTYRKCFKELLCCSWYYVKGNDHLHQSAAPHVKVFTPSNREIVNEDVELQDK